MSISKNLAKIIYRQVKLCSDEFNMFMKLLSDNKGKPNALNLCLNCWSEFHGIVIVNFLGLLCDIGRFRGIILILK